MAETLKSQVRQAIQEYRQALERVSYAASEYVDSAVMEAHAKMGRCDELLREWKIIEKDGC